MFLRLNSPNNGWVTDEYMIRREFLATVGTASTPLTALCLERNRSQPEIDEIEPFPYTLESEWRSKWGGPANTASTNAPGPPVDSEIVWEENVDAEDFPALAVGDGVLYIAGGSGRLIAMDTSAGSIVWTQTWNAELSSVAVADEHVYVDPGTDSVAAVDRSSGEQLWSQDTGTMSGPLVVAADGLYVISSGTLYAFDSDGTERWQYASGDAGRAPTVHDESVYVETDEQFVVLGREDGSIRWEKELPSDRPPALDGETAYLRGGSHIAAVDVSDGEVHWDDTKENLGGLPSWTLAVSDDRVTVAGEYVSVFDQSTGEERWRSEEDGAPEYKGVVNTSEAVFATSGHKGGDCFRFNPEDGTHDQVWRTAQYISAPLIVDEYLFVSTTSGRVLAIGPE